MEKENIELKDRVQNLEDQIYFLKIQVTRTPTTPTRESHDLTELRNSIKERDSKINRLLENAEVQKNHYENIIRSNNKILKRLACVMPTLDSNAIGELC